MGAPGDAEEREAGETAGAVRAPLRPPETVLRAALGEEGPDGGEAQAEEAGEGEGGSGGGGTATPAPTCAPRGLSRADFLAEPGISTSEFGLTTLDVLQTTFPELRLSPARNGRVQTTTAALPTIPSIYTRAGTFTEGTIRVFGGPGSDCEDGAYPLRWTISTDGANKIRDGEQEHCNDFQHAFDVSVQRYADAINALAASRRRFASERQAKRHLARTVGFDFDDLLTVFTCLANKTLLRDRRNMHTPRPRHSPPSRHNHCAFARAFITERSLRRIGTTSSATLIRGCGEHQAPAPGTGSASGSGAGQQDAQPEGRTTARIGTEADDRLLAPISIGATDDRLEQEADEMADRVMAPVGSGAAAPAHAMDAEAVQMKATGSATPQAPTGAAVGRLGGGRPMGPGERAFFEPRFGADFSGVRIHDGPEADTAARALGARAFTLGRDVAFARGEYAPGFEKGRHLMAHELAHVRQQERGAPWQVQRRRVTVGRGRSARVFEVGGVRIANRDAQTDILSNRALLPGTDQSHIGVFRGELGYEVSHTNPEDPFRWNKLKHIVDNGALDIKAVGLTDTIPSTLITGGTSRHVDVSLIALGGSGITLPRESLQRTIWAGNPTITASADANRDKIFYERRGSGATASVLGSNSLAHEFFGHYWLAIQGLPWAHPPSPAEAVRRARDRGQTLSQAERQAIIQRHLRLGTLTAARGVTDPFGNVFTGTVREYIDRFAGAEHGRVESPTRRVGPTHLASELVELRRSLLARGGLTLSGNIGNMSGEAANHWAFVSLNYEVLRQPPASTGAAAQPAAPAPAPAPSPSPAPSPAPSKAPSTAPPSAQSQPAAPAFTARSLVTAVADMWENDFSADQKAAFENLISTSLSSSFLSSIPDSLGRDVRTEIARRRASAAPSSGSAPKSGGKP